MLFAVSSYAACRFWQFFRHRAQPERSDQSSDQKAKRHAKQGKTQQCEDRNDVASLLEA
jgi:hypothetical protein